MSEQTKVCSKCGEVKSLAEFCKDTRRKSMFCSICRKCKSKYQHEWSIKNKEKLKIKNKKYRASNKEKSKQNNKSYRENNRDKSIEYSKSWYALNRERYKEKYINESTSLTDSFVANRLHIPLHECSHEIIKLKREQILLSRLTGKIKKEIANV